MFKRIIIVFIAGFVALMFLASCGSSFKADGVYRAFEETVNDSGAPEITSVSVTVKDGKITAYYIDSLQSAADANDKSGYVFNAKTKKELRYEYKMHYRDSGATTMAEYEAWLKDNDELEWFEQAKLLEDYWVENGIKEPTAEGEFDYVAGVTISDNDYVKVAKLAVENAKQGKTQVYTTSGSDLIWTSGKVDKSGKVVELKIDTRQASKDAAGKFVWNAKTKQELGYFYGMHKSGIGLAGNQDLTEDNIDAYKDYLEENGKLEWFEQANAFAAYVLANGAAGYTITEGKIVQNESTPATLAGITVTASHYNTVLKAVLQDLSDASKK